MANRRYAAFLRGVMPTNAKMPELKKCFEATGFSDVRTVLSSGNVVFGAPAATEEALQRKIERGMSEHLGKSFLTIVRSQDALRELLDEDPYAAFRLPPGAKRIVTFLRTLPASKPRLPVELDGAQLLCVRGRDVFSAYVPTPRGPVFMTLIQKQFGDEVTTRTWDTVQKVLKAAAGDAKAPGNPRRTTRV